MKIVKMGMFHTPKDQDELLNMIERHTGEERTVMLMAMAWTWNYLAESVNDEMDSQRDALHDQVDYLTDEGIKASEGIEEVLPNE